ncbi:MAG: hypothetical protein HDR31_01920 [Mycoplasma sp.]|nr:hypothetical protein [Mycoplasma sp.]
MNSYNDYNNSFVQDQYELIRRKYKEFQNELNSSGLLNFSDTFLSDFPLETLPSYVLEFINENKNIRKVIEQLNKNIGERINNLCKSLPENSVFEGLPVGVSKVNLTQVYYDIDAALQKVNEATTFVNDNLKFLKKISQENKIVTQKNKDLQAQIDSMSREISHQQFKLDKLAEENSIKDKELQNSFTYWVNNSQRLDLLEKLMNEQEAISQDVDSDRNELIFLLEEKIKKLVDSQKINKDTYESIKTKDVNSEDFYVGVVDLLHYFTFRYVSEIIGNASLLEKYSNNHLDIVKNLLSKFLTNEKDEYGKDILTLIENAQEDSLLIPNNDNIDEILVIKNFDDLKKYLKDVFIKKILKDKDKLKDLILTFESIKNFIFKNHGLNIVGKNIKEISDILNNFETVLQQYERNVSDSIKLLESNDNFNLSDELLKEKYWIKSINVVDKIYKLISEWYFDFRRVDGYLNCIDKKDISQVINLSINEQQINNELVKIAKDFKETLNYDIESQDLDIQTNDAINQESFSDIEDIKLDISNDNSELEDKKIEAIRNYVDKIVSASNQSIVDKINKLESFLKISCGKESEDYLKNSLDNKHKLLDDNYRKTSLMEFNSNKNLKLRLIKSKLIRLKIQTEILRNENYNSVLDILT